jgi:hypothetical protein
VTAAPQTAREGEATAADGPPPDPRRRRWPLLLAGLTGLVATLCALALPFAPVSVNEPTVTWPRDPGRPEPTLLTLTAYRPLALDATFTCAAARQAQASPAGPAGVVLATTQPLLPETPTVGLLVTARDERLQVRAMGRLLVDEPLGADCRYGINGTATGVPAYQLATPDPLDPDAPDLARFAGPDDAVLTVTRDGTELARASGPQLPSVDLLTTAVTAVEPGGLQVTLAVDDEFTSSPTVGKQVVIGLLVVALLATAALLTRLDRAVPRVPRRWRFALPRVVDVVVPAVIVFWMLVAPATDDDGYYAAMARNARISGEIGNYYQLHDQNFTPFTWFYYLLAWWQGVVGDAPVLQRILAVVFGLLTWVVLRRFVAAGMRGVADDRRALRVAAPAVLAVVFLAWWLPQDMGVRPETVVCLCGVVALHAVLVAQQRKRLAVAWLAFAVAGVGFAAHPTGLTLLAPLLAGLPLLWQLIAVPGERLATAVRAFAVASGGMVAPLLAFADGGLRDFLRGQTLFLSIQAQENWTTEIQRYTFLLTANPMGNYAKRAAVLVCLVALVWFAVLAVAARARRVDLLPTPLWLAGSATGLAFAALWLTPSKWTHHFGALAAIGPAFLALFLVLAVPTTRSVLGTSRLPAGVVAAAGVSFVMAIALGWHGPNLWPYAWLDGVRRPEFAPAISRVVLDSPVLWALILGAVAVALVLARRGRDRRFAALTAVPLVVVISLAGTTAYTVGTFGLAAVQGVPRSSLWAQSLADPTASNCVAAGATEVLDPYSAVPLPEAAGLPAPSPGQGFVADGGYYLGNRPQGAAASRTWGSLVARDGRSADATVGSTTTPWYELAGRQPGDAVTVLAAGSLTEGTTLTAEFGRRTGDAVEVLGTEALADSARGPSWRTLTPAPPADADVMRLVAVDESAALHGWVAFSAPALAQPVPLTAFLPQEAPVAVAWQVAFAYPCQRQVGIVNGITEPPAFAVLFGDGSALSGMRDATWQISRGGAFAQVPRSQSVLRLATVPPVDPNVEVYAFGSGLGRDRYTLTEDRRTTGGAATEVPVRPVG